MSVCQFELPQPSEVRHKYCNRQQYYIDRVYPNRSTRIEAHTGRIMWRWCFYCMRNWEHREIVSVDSSGDEESSHWAWRAHVEIEWRCPLCNCDVTSMRACRYGVGREVEQIVTLHELYSLEGRTVQREIEDYMELYAISHDPRTGKEIGQ